MVTDEHKSNVLELFRARGAEERADHAVQHPPAPPLPFEPIPTRIHERLLTRFQRTHDKRRASLFVGPAGLGKTTAIHAFRAQHPSSVIVIPVAKRQTTAQQALHQLQRSLSVHTGDADFTSAFSAVRLQQKVRTLLERYCKPLSKDSSPLSFPLLTVIFDEAQGLTNDALDALRRFNEPFYQCEGPFPIGLILVGNEELSLEVKTDGSTLLNAGMESRLLYSQRLSYADFDRADVDAYLASLGVEDADARDALTDHFTKGRTPADLRKMPDMVDAVRDEAAGAPITRETVRVHLLG